MSSRTETDTMIDTAQAKAEAVAKLGVATTGAAASATWFSVSEAMQFGSTLVAVIAGLATAWYYVDKVLAARKRRKAIEQQMLVLQSSMDPVEYAKFVTAHVTFSATPEAEDDNRL